MKIIICLLGFAILAILSMITVEAAEGDSMYTIQYTIKNPLTFGIRATNLYLTKLASISNPTHADILKALADGNPELTQWLADCPSEPPVLVVPFVSGSNPMSIITQIASSKNKPIYIHFLSNKEKLQASDSCKKEVLEEALPLALELKEYGRTDNFVPEDCTSGNQLQCNANCTACTAPEYAGLLTDKA